MKLITFLVLAYLVEMIVAVAVFAYEPIKVNDQKVDMCKSKVKEEYINQWNSCCVKGGKGGWCDMPRSQWGCEPSWSGYIGKIDACR